LADTETDKPPETPINLVNNPVTIPLRQQRRSFSQLTSYSQCGEAYRLERVAKAPSRPAAWFTMGTAAHLAIEEWENSGRKAKPTDLHDLYHTTYDTEIEKWHEEHGSYSVFMTGGFKRGEDDVKDRREIGWWQVQDYQRYALQEKHLWAVVESEWEFTVEIGGVPVTGKIDQVRVNLLNDNMPYPEDLKGGAKVPDHPVQLAVYDHALRQFTKTDGRAGFTWLGRPARGRSKERATESVPVALAEWPIERIEAWVTQMHESELAGIYLPNPTNDCQRTCGVAQFCRIKGDLPSLLERADGLVPKFTITTKEQDD
jgi:hypothetical protein